MSETFEQQVRKEVVVGLEPRFWWHRNSLGVLQITDRKPSWPETVWPPLYSADQVAALEQAVEDQRKLYANCVELAKELEALRAENERLRQVCRNAYEVWAGSEGIPEPKYASEAIYEAEAAQLTGPLRAALLDVARRVEALKKPCGMDPETPQAIRNGEYMSIALVARAALGPNAIAQGREHSERPAGAEGSTT